MNCFSDVFVHPTCNDEWGWECEACGTWAEGFSSRREAEEDSTGCFIPTVSVRGEHGLCVHGHDCTGPHLYLPW